MHTAGSKAGGPEPLSPLKLKLLILDVEIKDLVFSPLGFSLALVQYFLTMSPFLLSGMQTCILWHYMLKVYNLLLSLTVNKIS